MGAIMTGKVQDATRAEIQEYITGLVNRTLARSVAKMEHLEKELAAEIIADLDALLAREATDE